MFGRYSEPSDYANFFFRFEFQKLPPENKKMLVKSKGRVIEIDSPPKINIKKNIALIFSYMIYG